MPQLSSTSVRAFHREDARAEMIKLLDEARAVANQATGLEDWQRATALATLALAHRALFS